MYGSLVSDVYKRQVFKSGRLLQYDHPDTLLAHPADEFVSAFTGQDSTLKRLLLVRAEDAADSSLVTARPQTPDVYKRQA